MGRCIHDDGLTDEDLCGRALRQLDWEPARVVIARRPVQRLVGMIPARIEGRGSLPIVMAFFACSSVHTCFMRAPLDIAFLAEDGTVVAVCERVPPWRVRRHRGASAVLERFSRPAGPVRAGSTQGARGGGGAP